MPDQMKRLDRVARKRGISKQQFIEAAVIKELNEHEESSLRVKAEREEAIGQKVTRPQALWASPIVSSNKISKPPSPNHLHRHLWS